MSSTTLDAALRALAQPGALAVAGCTALLVDFAADAAPPGLFQQSLTFLDGEGERVRYNYIYTNQLPPLR